MPISDARKRANKKWNDANMKTKYDRIQLVVPKGERDMIKEYAKEQGKSLNNFVYDLIKKEMECSKVV